MKSAIDLYVINKIREKRKELNISQRGIADILGCSAGFIGEVESEKFVTKYSIHQLYLIAKEFECSPAEFFPAWDDDRFNFIDGKDMITGTSF
jgi:transcriptional regulator with XRE-family HTH domain